jgi:2-keto-4-pentenoate hydratase/2-oxohepta-3-ene-1,7-dioic acid hydratase in catechol pathway
MRFGIVETGVGPRFARFEDNTTHLYDKAPWAGGKVTGSVGFETGSILCPVAPTKIVAVGRNYAAHAKELGNEVPSEPLLFLKPPSALLGHGGTVVLPPESTRVEHEAELAVVIGKRARHVAEKDALGHVFGYTAACDVSARDLQRKDVQFTRAKGFDTFCPMGPWIETEMDPSNARVACRVNGKTKQDGSAKDMIFGVPAIVAYVSRVMTLEPGDVILTGTPEGVGPIVPGDALEVEIGGVGVLELRVGK